MAMTKSEISKHLAEKVGITKKQADMFFEELATLAHREAKNTFTLPGIGKLSVRDSPAREMLMRFGPKAGEKVMVPAKKKVKFTVAKAAKEAIAAQNK